MLVKGKGTSQDVELGLCVECSRNSAESSLARTNEQSVKGRKGNILGSGLGPGEKGLERQGEKCKLYSRKR